MRNFICVQQFESYLKKISAPFQSPRKMTHHFLKRTKRAKDLFKTFNLTNRTIRWFLKWTSIWILLYFWNNWNYEIISSNTYSPSKIFDKRKSAESEAPIHLTCYNFRWLKYITFIFLNVFSWLKNITFDFWTSF